MPGKRPCILTLLVMVAIIISLPEDSHAGLFEQLAGSTIGVTMGNAVTAYPPRVMAIHYNPAGLTKLKGTHFENGLAYVIMDRKVRFRDAIDPATGKTWSPFGGWFNDGIDPLNGRTGKIKNGYMVVPYIDAPLHFLIAPSMGVSRQKPGSRWTFAIGQYAPMGAGMEHDKNDPLSYLGQKGFFLRMILAAPAAAYRLTDHLSVGVSVGIGPSVLAFQSKARAPNTMVALTGVLGDVTKGLEIPVWSELTTPPPWFNGGLNPYENLANITAFAEDYFTTSYNLGLLWEPVDWFAFGACYQSESEATMKGDWRFAYTEQTRRTIAWSGKTPLLLIVAGMLDLPYQYKPGQEGDVTVPFTWPQRLQLGIMLRPTRKLRLTCDAHWTDWSVWESLQFIFDQKIDQLRLARILGYKYGPDRMVIDLGLENEWHFSYGLEYQVNPKLTVRMGYEPRPSSVKDEYWGPLPFADMKIYGLGITLNLEEKKKPHPKGFKELLHQLQKPTSIDFGLEWVKMDKKVVPNNASKNLNSTSFTNIIYAPYAGLDVTQEKFSNYVISLTQNFRW